MKLSPVPPGPKGHFLVGSLPEIQRDELDFLMQQGDGDRREVIQVFLSVLRLWGKPQGFPNHGC